MKINLRKEHKEDHKEVFALIEEAFKHEGYSDQSEHFLVENLKLSFLTYR